jgi:hypothetical protein
MTGQPGTLPRDSASPESATLLIRSAAMAGAREAARLRARAADWRRDTASRLDDRMRALLDHLLTGMVGEVEARLREDASRMLVSRGDRAGAARLRQARPSAAQRLERAGLLANEPLLAELFARLRQDLIAERLPVRADDDEPSLLARLAQVGDPTVAAAARGLLVAESRRREALAMGDVTASDLPAELHQQLVWRVAAALRDGDTSADRALVEAAGRILAGYDEGERADAQAMRLAFAIDARPQELPALLDEAIGDRRLSLVFAALALSAQVPFDVVRSLAVEPDDERWWLLLRAVDLDPLTMARLALASADPRRGDQDLPTLLDAANAVSAEEARAELAVLRLPPDFRAAVDALGTGEAA